MVPLTEKGRGIAVYIFILADGVGGWESENRALDWIC